MAFITINPCIFMSLMHDVHVILAAFGSDDGFQDRDVNGPFPGTGNNRCRCQHKGSTADRGFNILHCGSRLKIKIFSRYKTSGSLFPILDPTGADIGQSKWPSIMLYKNRLKILKNLNY